MEHAEDIGLMNGVNVKKINLVILSALMGLSISPAYSNERGCDVSLSYRFTGKAYVETHQYFSDDSSEKCFGRIANDDTKGDLKERMLQSFMPALTTWYYKSCGVVEESISGIKPGSTEQTCMQTKLDEALEKIRKYSANLEVTFTESARVKL